MVKAFGCATQGSSEGTCVLLLVWNSGSDGKLI